MQPRGDNPPQGCFEHYFTSMVIFFDATTG